VKVVRQQGDALARAILRRLVESWGGEVSVDSEPGVRTTVHLRMRGSRTRSSTGEWPTPIALTESGR
jgi:signal transduction histidine kinase